MRVALVSGSWPPSICGVGDYSAQLVEALRAEGIDAVPFNRKTWEWAERAAIAQELSRLRPDIVHVQYPTRGFGSSRVPPWLVWKRRGRRTIITLHEYSAVVGPARLGIVPRGLPYYWPFSFAGAVVFTSVRERDAYRRIAPWSADRLHVIPLASNIPKGTASARRTAMTYFGQICPNKGIEDFIAAAAHLKRIDPQLTVELVGGVPADCGAYATLVFAKLDETGVEVIEGAPAQDIADRLAASAFAFLPFPDGASDKRGSLLAALANDVIVMTYHSAITPDWIRRCTVAVADPLDAAQQIARYAASPAPLAELRDRLRPARIPTDWGAIAREHVSLFETQLQSTHASLAE